MRIYPHIKRRLSALSAAAVVLLLVGCASTKHNSHLKDRYVISGEEIETAIEQYSAGTAWDLVRLLRPNLLMQDSSRSGRIFKTRSGLTYTQYVPALLFVNGTPYGTKRHLKEINAGIVAGIRYVPAHEAGTLYGSNTGGGVFEVTLR